MERKKPKFSSKNVWKNALFCFFSLERLVHYLITKTCRHFVHSSLFEAKKIQLFLKFLLFLSNLLFIGIIFFVFLCARAPGVSNQHKNLHAPWGHDYHRSHKISDLFDFFAIFSRRSKSFDRTVTTQKGISISGTNGRGEKLSIPKK